MEIEIKWTIPEEDLKAAFGKLVIEDKYYAVFKDRANYRLNDIVYSNEPDSYDYEDSIDNASEYIVQYASQIERGKSPLYANQYAKHFFENNDEDFCNFYASKYEESINKGRSEIASIRIAGACEDYFDSWPDDNYLLGKEAIKGYMAGFEYAIDEGIDSPEDFAEIYMEEHISRLFPDEKDPPCRNKKNMMIS